MSSTDKENLSGSLEDGKRSSLRKRLPFNLEEDEVHLTELMKSSIDNPLLKITARLEKI